MLFFMKICTFIREGAQRIWNETQKSPYAVKKRLWVSYEDEQSVKEKVIANIFRHEYSKGRDYLFSNCTYPTF